MSNSLFNDNKMIWIIAVVCVILFVAMHNPMERFSLPDKYKLDYVRTCSTDCCSSSQYLGDVDTVVDPDIQAKLQNGELIGTNMMCDGISGSGCICATPDQYQFMGARGNNGVSSC